MSEASGARAEPVLCEKRFFLSKARPAQEPDKLLDKTGVHDGLFRSSAVLEIAVTLPLRRAASGSMNAADAIAAYRRRATPLSCSFRFGIAARGVVGTLHGVVAHFFFSTPPIPTRSGSISTGIGVSELAARREGDATLRGAPTPVASASLRNMWSATY